MTAFTRCTIVGSVKKVTLVIPSEDPLGTHIGHIITLVQEPDMSDSIAHLVHPTGESLNLTHSLEEQHVRDGQVLHLVRERDVPPPPEVADISDEVAQAHDQHVALATPKHRSVTASITAGVAATLLALTYGPQLPGWLIPALTGILTLGSALLAWLEYRVLARVGLAAGIGGTVTSCLAFSHLLATWEGLAWLIMVAVWTVIGIVLAAGERRPAPALGAVCGILLAGTGLGVTLTVGPVEAAGVVAALTVLVFALLPNMALRISGVTGLDDTLTFRGEVARTRVASSIGEAFTSLQWAQVAAALAGALSTAILLMSESGWFAGLGAITALILVLRTRLTPLAVASVATWAFTLAAVAFVWVLPQNHELLSQYTPAFAVVLVLATLTATLNPVPHAAARLRRLGDLAETFLALAVVPVLLGGFGVYSALLGVFR